MDKNVLRTAVVRQLQLDLDLQTQAALTSHDEATNEESKAENKYDMHAQEAAYLAEGQARIVADLRETIAQFLAMPVAPVGDDETIAVGAVITLRDSSGATSCLLLGPRSGGLEIEVEGNRYLVVTPSSPLGRQLLGRRTGDKVTMLGRGQAAAQTISSVL